MLTRETRRPGARRQLDCAWAPGENIMDALAVDDEIGEGDVAA